MLTKQGIILLILLGIVKCQDDFDPSIGFLQIFDQLSQDEVALPKLTIEDISQNDSAPISTTTSTNTPVVIQVQDIQLSGSSEVVAPKDEVMDVSSVTSGTTIQIVDLSSSVEVEPAQQIVTQQYTTTPPAIAVPPVIPAQEPTISQMINFRQPNLQLQAPNSAFIVPGAVADIYGSVDFPTLYRSGSRQSQFQIEDVVFANRQALPIGSELPDVDCKPLLQGNACLYTLLQSITFFYNALKRSGVMDVVCGFSPLTIVAPTDSSFAKLAQELDMIAEDFLAIQNQQVLRQIIQLHLFPEIELSPQGIVERSSVIPEVLTSWLGQFVYSTTDGGNIYFRPPLAIAPTTTAILSLSGQNIYLQEGCVVDYLYVVQNVLMPDFSTTPPPVGG